MDPQQEIARSGFFLGLRKNEKTSEVLRER
jgi:hypothetical protein